jgi:hypothetical protein
MFTANHPPAFCLCMLGNGGFCAFTFADLIRGEFASTNAATPAGRGELRHSGNWLLIRAPGSDQFATAPRTFSSNHRALKLRKVFWSLCSRLSCQDGSCDSLPR